MKSPSTMESTSSSDSPDDPDRHIKLCVKFVEVVLAICVICIQAGEWKVPSSKEGSLMYTMAFTSPLFFLISRLSSALYNRPFHHPYVELAFVFISAALYTVALVFMATAFVESLYLRLGMDKQWTRLKTSENIARFVAAILLALILLFDPLLPKALASCCYGLHAVCGRYYRSDDTFGLWIQDVLYTCWIFIIVARLDVELFQLEGFDLFVEMFCTFGGGVDYSFAGLSTAITLSKFRRSGLLIAQTVLAFTLALVFFVEFTILCIAGE